MAHEAIVNEFVEKMKAAAGTNLASVILYGSAAQGEFHPEYSDLNLLCIMRDASFASLSKIASVVEWWRGKKHHPPLVLTLPMHLHRSQLEYELREKLFLLRQHIMLAGSNEKQLWEVMLQSLSSFTTLFRHTLIELGQTAGQHSLDAVKEVGTRLNFDSSAFVHLIEVRARKTDRKQLRAAEVAAQYLTGIETVAAAVDTIQSSSTTS
ncbi:MAG: hypothetical protein DMG95_01150 [Acidobacteria bacterium]|nr:MAG: hypothetical protein DMG95_01150 [Acidobacteriota bacterium]